MSEPLTAGRRLVLRGVIASSGFSSGHRVVVGHWWQSPIGAFTDVMWAEPDGLKVLYVPDDRVARFVTSVYRFDRIEIEPFRTRAVDRSLVVELDGRVLSFVAGRGIPLPGPRPAALTRWVERPLARLVLGVRTYGVSPTGVREWYQAAWWRPLRSAAASIDGVDLGDRGPVDPPVRFGFSEPPRRPCMVGLRTLLVDPSGRLDVVAGHT